jgi:predicted glutamine amidotransferase
MCRLLALVAREDAQPGRFLEALKSAAEHDPYLPSGGSHRDGWGLAAVSLEEASGGELLLYKSGRPMWEDSNVSVLQQLLRSPLAMIAHVRKASSGMPRGVGAAHPFAVNLGDGGLLVVAQNGTISVDGLLRMIKRKVEPGNVDSYLYAVALAERLEEAGDLAVALEELHGELEEQRAVIRMANTVVLLLRRTGNGWSAEVGVVKHVVDRGAARYGELYVLRSQGLFAAASITVAENLRGGLQLEPLEGNSVLVVDAGSLEVRLSPLSKGRKQ